MADNGTPDNFDGRFYSDGNVVLRRPLHVKKPEGGGSVTMGFRVCTITEEVSDDAAQTIATALNRMIDSGEIPNGPATAAAARNTDTGDK